MRFATLIRKKGEGWKVINGFLENQFEFLHFSFPLFRNMEAISFLLHLFRN